MRITDIETFIVGTPPPHNGGQYWIFVKLITDDNIVGYGEIYAPPFGPYVVEKMIADMAERFVIGEDPHNIEKIWRRAYFAGYTGRPDTSMIAIVSGIEAACWDIIGKAAGQPIYNFLGGRIHEKIRTYSYIYPFKGEEDLPENAYNNADKAAEVALDLRKQGFTAVKFDPVGHYSPYDPRQLSLQMLEFSEKVVKTIREAVGNNCDLLFGTHGQLTPSGAIRLAERLEPYSPLWFEEPTAAEMPEQMALVARATTIPISTGERLVSKYEFARVLQHNAASILQFAVGRVGGLLEAKKIASMGEAYYAQTAPHLYCGPIEAAANIHLDCATPNFLIQESILQMGDFHAEVLKKPLQWQDGYFIPPTEPGLGVELNEEVCRANPYKGNLLHLNPTQTPIFDHVHDKG